MQKIKPLCFTPVALSTTVVPCPSSLDWTGALGWGGKREWGGGRWVVAGQVWEVGGRSHRDTGCAWVQQHLWGREPAPRGLPTWG